MTNEEDGPKGYACCLPILPHVTFRDLSAIEDPGIIPFTAADFGSEEDTTEQLRADIKSGAKGLKIHPILQRQRLTGNAELEQKLLYKNAATLLQMG